MEYSHLADKDLDEAPEEVHLMVEAVEVTVIIQAVEAFHMVAVVSRADLAASHAVEYHLEDQEDLVDLAVLVGLAVLEDLLEV